MPKVRNNTPSRRSIGKYQILPKQEVEIPADVIDAYQAKGPGIKRLFDSGMLTVKGAGRVVRMESAPVNVAPESEEKPAKKKRGRKKKTEETDA